MRQSRPVRFGLDFGTSNTSVAVWDGERSTVLPIDPLAGAAVPAEITIGRPVEYVGGAAAEARAVSRMRRAADLAGFSEVRFAFEPVGAAHAAEVTPGLTLVFDFGGGTLDLAVVRRERAGSLE